MRRTYRPRYNPSPRLSTTTGMTGGETGTGARAWYDEEGDEGEEEEVWEDRVPTGDPLELAVIRAGEPTKVLTGSKAARNTVARSRRPLSPPPPPPLPLPSPSRSLLASLAWVAWVHSNPPHALATISKSTGVPARTTVGEPLTMHQSGSISPGPIDTRNGAPW